MAHISGQSTLLLLPQYTLQNVIYTIIYTVTRSVAMHGSGHLNATYKSHRHTASILHGHIQPSTMAYTKSINLFMVRLGEAIQCNYCVESLYMHNTSLEQCPVDN